MTSATVNGNDAATLDLDALSGVQEALRAQIKALMTRLEAMRVRVEAAEAAEDEADALRMQVRALTARLEAERTTHAAMASPRSPAAAEGLREAYEEMFANHAAVTAERDQLAHACQTLETRLAEAEEIHAEEVANLKAERDDWIAFAEELERELAKEREEQRELEGLAESSMSEGERLRQGLQQTERELSEARLPAAGTWEKLVNQPPTSRPRTRLDEAPGVAGQLALPITQASQATDGEATTEDQRDEKAPLTAIPAPVVVDGTPIAEFPTTDTNVVTGNDVQEPETVYATDVAPDGDVLWQEQFARIEQAWLADLPVGDEHERRHLREIAARVRRVQSDLHDNDALLRELDALRHRYGDGFSYCLLDGALRQLHRPRLAPSSLLKRCVG